MLKESPDIVHLFAAGGEVLRTVGYARRDSLPDQNRNVVGSIRFRQNQPLVLVAELELIRIGRRIVVIQARKHSVSYRILTAIFDEIRESHLLVQYELAVGIELHVQIDILGHLAAIRNHVPLAHNHRISRIRLLFG